MNIAVNLIEKRKSERRSVKVEVKIGTEIPEYSAYIMNISRTGALIQSTKIYPVGTNIIIRVIDKKVRKKNTELISEVVWLKEEKEKSVMGVKFKTVSKVDEKEHS